MGTPALVSRNDLLVAYASAIWSKFPIEQQRIRGTLSGCVW